MIQSVAEHPKHDRTHRSAVAEAPSVGMPSFSDLLDMVQVSGLPGPSACAQSMANANGSLPLAAPAPIAPSPSTPLAADLASFTGQSVGSGQCVALVRAAIPALGPSSTWTAGAIVKGNTALQPGTPIATFEAGRYTNSLDGSSHAAIYLGQDANGMKVMDQWVGSSASIRTIPWKNPSGIPANTGSAFRVVSQS